MLVAERIRVAVRDSLTGVPTTLPLTASIGVALHRASGGATPTGDAMVRQADAAMYAAKASGKDCTTAVTL